MRCNQPTSGAFLALTLLLSFDLCALGAGVPRFAFVANANDNTVSIYSVNGVSAGATTGLKPRLILNTLRGAQAPLFHSTARVPEFFRSVVQSI
jgi:hypothetical protein